MNNLIDESAIGVEVSWDFGDGNADSVLIDRVALRSLLTEFGYDADHISSEPAREHALKRATWMTRKFDHIVMNELAGPNKDTPVAYGVYLRTPGDESGDGFQMHARVRIDSTTGDAVVLPPEGSATIRSVDCANVAEMIRRHYQTQVAYVINYEISNALTAIGYGHGWIPRRSNKGGTRFLLRSAGERFAGLLQAIAQLSQKTSDTWRGHFRPQIVEQYPKPLTMATWSASAEAEFRKEIDELVVKLGQHLKGGDKTRQSTYESRIDECDALIKRADAYRLFLTSSGDRISKQLSELQGQFRTALAGDLSEAHAAFEKFAALTAEAS